MECSKECVIQLIDEHKKRDVIWNPKNTEHFNKKAGRMGGDRKGTEQIS
jgi:hypothetical protein